MAEHSSVRGVAVSGIDLVKRRMHSLRMMSRMRPGRRRYLAALLACAIPWLQPALADDLLLHTGEALISTRIEGRLCLDAATNAGDAGRMGIGRHRRERRGTEEWPGRP